MFILLTQRAVRCALYSFYLYSYTWKYSKNRGYRTAVELLLSGSRDTPSCPASSIADCELYQTSERNQAPRFRTEFDVPSADVAYIRAYVAGLGYHQLFVDGERVSDAMLEPGWSVTERTTIYSVYDLKALVSGRHAVGIELGNGWCRLQ